MSSYFPGDVVLALMDLGGPYGRKARPAVVVSSSGKNRFSLCPVTSRQPGDADFVPLDLDDFETGGLDLFEESYVLISGVCKVDGREILGKKGRLSEAAFSVISARSLR